MSKRQKNSQINEYSDLCSHVFVFSTIQEIPLKIYYDDICLPWALAFFYESASFAFPIVKHIG